MSIDRLLEQLQDLSGLTFTAFLALHLAAPVAGALASPTTSQTAASNVQLATRVVYQDGRLRELLFVWVPLGTHLVVAVVRRISRINRRRRIRAQLELRARQAEPQTVSGPPARWASQPQSTSEWLKSYLPRTSHATAGYIGIPLLLDHIFHHRLNAPPILRSFQFVGFSLRQAPVWNSIKYTALVSSLVYHSLVGLDQIRARLLAHSSGRTQSGTRSISESQGSVPVQLAWLGIVGTVGLGIRKLAREEIPPWIARRYS